MASDADVRAVGDSRSAQRLRTNPELVVVQGRLLSPGFAAAGKWAILDPRTLRSVAAVPDVRGVPPILRLLDEAAAGDAAAALVAVLPGADLAHLEDLAARGLLIDAGAATSWVATAIGAYHLAVYDYPFLDHATSSWKARDARLMDAYAAEAPHPPPLTPRDGPRTVLPPPDDAALTPDAPRLAALATALHVALAPTGWIDGGRHGPWMRRTSPSGGARHPVDGVVVLGEPLDSIPAGAYAYDPAAHALVPVLATSACVSLAACGRAAVALRARVERVQWRYREARALRPLLLDVGHVAETVVELLRRSGWRPRVVFPSESPADGPDWLVEPTFAAIIDDGGTGAGAASARKLSDAEEGGGAIGVMHRQQLSSRADTDSNSGGLRTNPAALLHFREGRLRGEAVWPWPGSLDIDEASLAVLTHCLPSRRDDRDVTPAGIRASVGCDETTVDRLAAAGLLLPHTDVGALERALSPWVAHGWYLSALAVLAGRADGVRAAANPTRPVWPPLLNERLLEPLRRRRTSRRFADSDLPRRVLERVLAALVGCATEAPDASGGERGDWDGDGGAGIAVYVGALGVDGLDAGLYRWHPTRGLTSTGASLTRDNVRAWSVGQTWAGDGSAVVWLVRTLDLNEAGGYEPALIDLGRLGQRVCVDATAAGAAVFETPALRDGALFSALGAVAPEQSAAYAITLGVPVTS